MAPATQQVLEEGSVSQLQLQQISRFLSGWHNFITRKHVHAPLLATPLPAIPPPKDSENCDQSKFLSLALLFQVIHEAFITARPGTLAKGMKRPRPPATEVSPLCVQVPL